MDKRRIVITDDQAAAVQKAWLRDYGEELTPKEARRKASVIMRGILAQEGRLAAAKKV